MKLKEGKEDEKCSYCWRLEVFAIVIRAQLPDDGSFHKSLGMNLALDALSLVPFSFTALGFDITLLVTSHDAELHCCCLSRKFVTMGPQYQVVSIIQTPTIL